MQKGTKHTEESIQKMSLSRKSIPKSEDHKEKLSQSLREMWSKKKENRDE